LADKYKFVGLSQYKVAYNHELAGRHFHLVMDSGEDISLYFMDGENVQIAERGQPYVFETYNCLKGDDTTYLVHVQPAAGKGLINKGFILDTAQNLVTIVILEEAFDPEYPRLIRVTPSFGAIKAPGRELPAIRHHLSKRMVGRHIVWHYNDGMDLQHIYYAPTVMRAGPAPGLTQETMLEKRFGEDLRSDDPERRARGEEGVRIFEERNKWYPFFEEECFHIWISDRLNLFCFVEENMTRRSPDHGSGGGGILLLQDIERCVDVGISFSAGEYYMCTAFGEEDEIENPLDTAESPFDYSDHECLPSVHWEIPED
jgi:hypothetical protein